MKFKTLALAAAVGALLCTGAMAQDKNKLSAADKQAAQKIEKSIKEKFPNTTVESVTPSEIKGLYEVQAGKNIFFSDPNGRYVVFGSMFDTVSRTDLTAPKRESANKLDMRSLNYNDAIKTVKGNGARKLVVFSDPDCPYCRQLEGELEKVDNVTVYTFPFPLKSLHPKATARAISIWCSSNPAQAWSDYILKRIEPQEANCPNPIERNIQLAAKLGIQGTPALIAANGALQPGAMDADKLNQWLDANSKK